VRILSAAFLPLILLVPSVTEAQPPKAPEAQPPKAPEAQPPKAPEFVKGPVGKALGACGARILPLVEGNQWTYTFVAAPTPPRDDIAKLSPSQPKEIVITVKTVETKGPDTVVTLEEKTTADLSKNPDKHILDQRTITSTITCNPKKFEISPDSFFFAGEPGGSLGLTFDKLERSKDTSWKLVNGTIGESDWREDIVAHFTRTSFPGSGAKLDSGKLELERTFKPAKTEDVTTNVGFYNFAEHIVLATTGRVTLDHPQPDVAPLPLPLNWNTELWLVPNVGVIQVLNSYSHKYVLSGVQLK
jgi:hypothetical protein